MFISCVAPLARADKPAGLRLPVDHWLEGGVQTTAGSTPPPSLGMSRT
jgi:hypothetical protein